MSWQDDPIIQPAQQQQQALAPQPAPQTSAPAQPVLPAATTPLNPQQTPHLTAAMQPPQQSAAPLQPQQQPRWMQDPIVQPAQQQQQQAPGFVNGMVRSAAEGIPIVGGLVPKLEAGTNAALSYALNPLFNEKDQLKGSFGERYSQSLKEQLGESAAFQQEHPVMSTAAGIAGGVGAMAPIGATSLGAQLLGLTAKSLPGAVAASAASGAGIGALDTAVRGGDLSDIKKSAIVSGMVGGALPIAGNLAGRAYRGIRDTIAGGNVGAPENFESIGTSAVNPSVADPRIRVSGGQAAGDQTTQMFEQGALRGNLGQEPQRVAENFFTGQDADIQGARNTVGRAFDPGARTVAADTNEMGGVVGDAVRRAAAASKANYNSLYEAGYGAQGDFASSVVENMGQKIRNNLPPDLVIDPGLTPMANHALNYIDSTISKLKVPNANVATGVPVESDAATVGINMRGIEQIRKNLVAMTRRTQYGSPDQSAMRSVIGEFDNRIQSALSDGLFTGNADQALESIKSARAAYAQHMQDFKADKGDFGVGAAMERIIGRNGNEGATPEEISRYLIGTAKTGNTDLARRLPAHIRDIVGENSPAWSAIRQGAWQQMTEGGPQKVSKAINDFLGSTAADQLYSPAEQIMMRRYANIMDQVTPKQGAVNYSNTAGVLGMMIKQTLAHVGAMLTGGVMGGPLGAGLGVMAHHGMVAPATAALANRGTTGAVARSLYHSPARQAADRMFAQQMARYGAAGARYLQPAIDQANTPR